MHRAIATRRRALRVLLGAGSSMAFGRLGKDSMKIAIGNRAHILARPHVKSALVSGFAEVLGCGAPAALNAAGLPEPILAFQFPDGGSISVEFSEDAPDEHQARRGAWLELQSDDPDALRRRVIAAGFAQLRHPATTTFYFAVPGGQVFGIVPRRG